MVLNLLTLCQKYGGWNLREKSEAEIWNAKRILPVIYQNKRMTQQVKFEKYKLQTKVVWCDYQSCINLINGTNHWRLSLYFRGNKRKNSLDVYYYIIYSNWWKRHLKFNIFTTELTFKNLYKMCYLYTISFSCCHYWCKWIYNSLKRI